MKMNEQDAPVKTASFTNHLKYRPNNFENNFTFNKKSHHLNSLNDKTNKEKFKSTNSINFSNNNINNNYNNNTNKFSNLKKNENLKDYVFRNPGEVKVLENKNNLENNNSSRAPSGKPPISPRSVQNFTVSNSIITNNNTNQSPNIFILTNKLNNQFTMNTRTKSREKLSNSHNNIEAIYDNLEDLRNEEIRNRLITSISSNSSSCSQTSSVFMDSPTREENLDELPELDNSIINRGFVQNLKKKFAPTITDVANNVTSSKIKRINQPEIIENYQLKKCQSVIMDLNKNSSLKQSPNIKNDSPLDTFRKGKITNSTGNLLECLNQNKIEEISVFENVDIKSKINRFSNDKNIPIQNVESKAIKKITFVPKSITEPLKHAESCQNLDLKMKKNLKNSSNNTSDDEFSMNSTFSDDQASSSPNENNKNISKYKSEINNIKNHEKILLNKKSSNSTEFLNESSKFLSINSNILNSTNFDPVKFEENYKKIKEAFIDLKKDNELIESLLTDMRNKVKETTATFSAVTNFDGSESYENGNYFQGDSDQENKLPNDRQNYTSINSLVPAVLKISRNKNENIEYLIKHKF